MHKATKIHAGLYNYRGWKIENMTEWNDEGRTFWNMTPAGEMDATDTENTLKQCKAFIDQCEDKQQEPAPAPILDEIAAYCDDLDAAAQLETVPTSALREGDRIKCNGCLMQLGPIRESRSHKPNEHGAVYWSRARVLEQQDGTIPQGWFDRDDQGNRTWLIQGNDLATWRRYK